MNSKEKRGLSSPFFFADFVSKLSQTAEKSWIFFVLDFVALQR